MECQLNKEYKLGEQIVEDTSQSADIASGNAGQLLTRSVVKVALPIHIPCQQLDKRTKAHYPKRESVRQELTRSHVMLKERSAYLYGVVAEASFKITVTDPSYSCLDSGTDEHQL
jgi:hypothetical protein